MQRFIPALEHLSRGGMSEDESDHAYDSDDEGDQVEGENGGHHVPQSAPQRRRYKIKSIHWRSPDVTKWLRTMDLVHIGTRFYDDGTPMPGNQARERYPGTKTQIGRPITGLPRNFYDAEWLKTLDLDEIAGLGVQPEIDINFTVNERR
jgi:hypothetical protein